MDVRELLNDIIDDARVAYEAGVDVDLAATILAHPRLAVLILPPVFQRPAGNYAFAFDEARPAVLVSKNGVIQFGTSVWDTREGDNPTPLSATLVAAHRFAQEL